MPNSLTLFFIANANLDLAQASDPIVQTITVILPDEAGLADSEQIPQVEEVNQVNSAEDDFIQAANNGNQPPPPPRNNGRAGGNGPGRDGQRNN